MNKDNKAKARKAQVVIQKILWPQVDVCSETELFFRINKKCLFDNQCLLFKEGGEVSSNTYFNGVSIDKWIKYTILETLCIRLKVKGKFKLSLCSQERVNDKVITHILYEKIITSDGEEIEVKFPDNIHGMAYFSLVALEDHSEFLNAEYFTEVNDSDIHNVKIAIDICTYKREDFVYRNLEIIRKCLIENENSALNGKLEVYVSDNGKTLDSNKAGCDQIHIFQNKNAGGTSGFTRGMIEILNANKIGDNITHILLMDDDVVIEPESIERTYRILSLLKDKYLESFIGGAMLRSDSQNIQIESGAVWNGGKLRSLKVNLDMNTVEACLYNEVEETREYNAWWYCCMPVGVIREDNLPMPLFIRGDDVEYGLRNRKALILMNGICVWHEPFDYKHSSYFAYYILRNQLIDNALHCRRYKKSDLKEELIKRVGRELIYYRYKEADLLMQAVEDFLKGVDWLLETDAEKLHKKILDSGYKAQKIEDLKMKFYYSVYKNSLTENDSKFHRLFRLLTLNGYLLPVKRNNIVSMTKVRPYNLYRTKKVMYYDENSNTGFVEQRSFRKFIQGVYRLLKVIREIDRNYNKVKREYRDRAKELQNIDFWNRYLMLNDN